MSIESEGQGLQRWLLVIGVLILGWLLWLLSPILTPFIISAFLAYLGDPLVDRLETHKIKRGLGVILVYVLILLLMVILAAIIFPRIENQVSLLMKNAPGYFDWIKAHLIPWAESVFGHQLNLADAQKIQTMLEENWVRAGGTLLGIFSKISTSGLAVLAVLMNLVLIPVLTFYLLRDWDQLMAGIHMLFPRQIEPRLTALVKESDQMLSQFLRGQMLVMTALAMIYTTGLYFVGLEFALLIGLFAGALSFVPYLGLILGILLAGIASILQFKGIEMLHWVVLVFVIGQLIEGLFLTPKLVGKQIGLHPVAVIFAVMAGGQLYGFFGILLALPLAAVAMVLVRHAIKEYHASYFYLGSKGEIENASNSQ